MRPPPPLLLATVVAAIAGGCLVYGWSHGATVVAAPQPVDIAAPAAIGPDAPPTANPDARGAAPAAGSAPAPERLSSRIDRLSRSSNPVDVFAAYRLVTDCLWARDHEAWLASHIAPGDRAQLPSRQAACGDIASDQIQSRLRWLQQAALAGVHHAATAMAHEGPDGLGLAADADLDAPQYADWKQRVDAAYDAGVRTCDPESLDYRVNAYENGAGVPQDRAKALTYWVAYVDCRKRLNVAPSAILGNGDSVTQRMGGTLDAEQIADAVRNGQQLARDARPWPGDS